MALLTPTAGGAVLSYQAAAGGGDTYANTGKEHVHVRNGGGAPITVTMVRTVPCTQGVTHAGAAVIASDQFTVTNASDKLLPAVDPAIYGPVVGITYSGVTSVTVSVIS